jgi:hypothetical protein
MESYDKVRVLRSEDVRYGRPQYFQHVVQDKNSADQGLPPFAHNPFRSGEGVQHLVAVRSRDPKPLGISHPDYGYSGRVFIQEAFDKKGRLRLRPGSETAACGPPAQAVPSDEDGGSIFLHLGGAEGQSKVADAVEIVRGVPMPYSKVRPNLSARLSKAAALGLSRTVQEMQEEIGSPPPRSSPVRPSPKAGRRSSGAQSTPPASSSRGASPAVQFPSPAHRRLYSSQGAGPEHEGDMLMEGLLSIFEDKAKGQPRIPIALGSAVGRLAMASGEVGLEGCGYVESPFTTARSTVPSKYDDAAEMADIDEMLRNAPSPQRKPSKAIVRLSQAGGAQNADQAVKRTRELDDQEKELKRVAADLSADVSRRARRLDFLQKDIERCEKEEADARKLLQALLDVAAPLRKQMQEVNYRVDAQKKILEKYKEEHGEKGIYKTLRKEIKDELNTFQDVKDELAQYEPKEKSKRKQLEEKERQTADVKSEHAKMQAKLTEMQEKIAGANAELRSFRTMKKEVLSQLEKGSPTARSPEEHRPACSMAEHDRPADRPGNNLSQNQPPGDASPGAHRQGDSVEEAARMPPPHDDDSNVHKVFASTQSWLRRYSLAARAKSPRWRDRLLKELQIWRLKNVDKVAMKPKYNGSEPLLGQPSSAFIAKIKMPTALSRRWETFCRHPPPPFEDCTDYKVTFESRSMQHVQVTFSAEPKGYLHSFILSFKQNILSEDDMIFADQIATLDKNVFETTTFTSLSERWAREGLIADSVSDLRALQEASAPRAEETWYLETQVKSPSLVQELQEKAAVQEIGKIALFKDAPIALLESLAGIASVLWAPAQAKVLDQGTIGDAMYYIVSGSVMKLHVQGPPPHKALGVVKQGECFCERRLIEVGPNEETVETLEDCKLYRFSTQTFLNILSPFEGFYENLIKLSWKREAEWEFLQRPGGKIKPPGNMPFRWSQLAGPVYHARKSKTLRAEIHTESMSQKPEIGEILEHMQERRGARPETPPLKWPAKINRWGKVDLSLNTELQEGAAMLNMPHNDGWWRDKGLMTEADALNQASSQAERYGAIQARASALQWRKHQLYKLGEAMVNSIS